LKSKDRHKVAFDNVFYSFFPLDNHNLNPSPRMIYCDSSVSEIGGGASQRMLGSI
jgi:hypothetical protein